jgi:chromosome segregation ATPase
MDETVYFPFSKSCPSFQVSMEARTSLLRDLAVADERAATLRGHLFEAEERLRVLQARQSTTSNQAAAAQATIHVLSTQLSKVDGKLTTLQQAAAVDRDSTAEARQRAAVLEVRLETAWEQKAEFRSRAEANESMAARLQDSEYQARAELEKVRRPAPLRLVQLKSQFVELMQEVLELAEAG